jgi:hypothetical protein
MIGDASGGRIMAILAETVEQRLRRLESVWEEETCVLSNPNLITGHWAFQEIIGMGPAVVPILLRDLEKEPKLWVWALPAITGENPVAPADGGNIGKMSEAWVRWGREKGYRW